MSEFITSDANMEQSKFASDILGLGRDFSTALPWLLLQQLQVQMYSFNSNPPFPSAGQGRWSVCIFVCVSNYIDIIHGTFGV